MRSVHQGNLFFPQEDSSRKKTQWADHGVWPADAELTEREREVVEFIFEGYTNGRIADVETGCENGRIATERTS